MVNRIRLTLIKEEIIKQSDLVLPPSGKIKTRGVVKKVIRKRRR